VTERLKDKACFTRHYRKIDYEEFAAALKSGEYMFYESPETQPLKRQTIWKATKKLSVMVGKKVIATYGEKSNGTDVKKGYLFTVV
jgi:hypothetical protein